MSRALSILILSASFSCDFALAGEASSQHERPNFLFILVDDLGAEWLSCYGSESITTPALDRLAEQGMRFTNAYVMPQCTPTRVSLLTGQYPWRHGWVNHWDVPRWGSGCHFDPDAYMTFARVLRTAGYVTAAAGKWQINDFRVQPDAMARHGFDHYCMWTGFETGNDPSAERYWNPYIHTTEGSRSYTGRFGPDVFTDYLLEFMREHRDRPMLMYYPMALVHTPLTTTPLDPSVEGKTDRHKAMVRYVEHCVQRLLDGLDQLGLREKTIVIFTTDNGTAAGLEARVNGRSVRGGKATLTEAGVRVPFIVNGPGRVPAGIVTDALTDITDVFPTLIELAGASLPRDSVIDGKSMAPVWLGEQRESGRDWIMAMGFGPADFRDGRVVPKKPFADRVIRNKRFKLWIEDGRASRLFDLGNDPGETMNLIDSDDRQVAEASASLQKAVADLPMNDDPPRYTPTPVQPWDRHRPEPLRFDERRSGEGRPDILLILTDDQRHDAIGAFSHGAVRTPNMDRLAASGTVFSRCYIMGSTRPAVCMPSRAMLMTGRHLYSLENDGGNIPDDQITLPEYLQRQGYTTFGTGKWHNGPESYARSFSAGGAIFFGGMCDHDRVPVHEFDPTGQYPPGKRRIATTYSSELFTDTAIRFLDQYQEDAPLFMYVSYTAPHDPRMAPKPYADLYPPEDIKLPPNVYPEHPFDNGELKIRDELLAPFPRTPAMMREQITAYYAMISHLDVHLGRLLSAWERRDRSRQGVIVFGGDNGLAVGQHGLLGKQNLYEHSTRVPLIIAGAGVPAGQKRDGLCYLHDIFPTLTDWIGLVEPDTVESRSLKPMLLDPQQRAREDVFLAYREVQRGLSDGAFKLIEYDVNGQRTTQLFDLRADPWETHDLAGEESYAARIREMRERLGNWRQRLGDPDMGR